MKRFVGPVFMKHWIRIFSVLICTSAFSQDIAVGTWRTHFSYQNIRLLELAGDRVFCAAENGFFSRDLQTGETRKLSKIDGLSDIGITAMSYSPGGVLVIGYESGIIDLIFEDKVVSITSIATSNLNRDKRINDISVSGSKGYIASDFGVVVVDFDQEEIVENFLQIGEEGEDVIAEEVVIQNDSLFILTAEGIQTGILTDNLLDFNNWTRYSGTVGFSDLVSTSQGLFVRDEESLVKFQGGVWTDIGVDLPIGGDKLIEADSKLFAPSGNSIYAFTGTSFEEVLVGIGNQINDFIIFNGTEFLVADSIDGLLDANGSQLSPDGPAADEFSKVRIVGDKVFGFNAPGANTYDGSTQETSYSLFSEGIWAEDSIDGFANVSDVGMLNGVYYFSSIGDGLYIEGEGVVDDIPGSSSELDTVLTGISVNQSLFLTGHSDQPFHALTAEGQWFSYNSSQVFGDRLEEVAVSERGIAWLRSSAGTFSIFDLIENTSDVISTVNGLPAAVLDFDISIEDDVWVATSQGPALFADASSIFSDSQALLPAFEGRVLFEGERINTVLTDGGNRIWFGTNRGLWVFDENTSERAALFDESNSPLPSDEVLDLAYNGRSGEMFVVTNKGMVSYRSASSVGSSTHTDVKVFPNPVRPDFQGPVGIDGLASNVTLKITDISGNLVREVRANGGSASWDLLNVNGQSVVTGIYYFFSATSDGKETFVGKLAVIR